MSNHLLHVDDPHQDPLILLETWLVDAAQRTDLPNPNAMSLATVDTEGQPSLRMVLLKKLDQDGAVFFTNTRSRKGLDLAKNPRAALLFHWDEIERQVRIEGAVTRTSNQEDDEYFASRPRLSRISAIASPQSEPLKDRAHLDRLFQEIEAKYPDENIERPMHWGGYRVALERIEFWQGARDRLHDRLLYTREADGWTMNRLAP